MLDNSVAECLQIADYTVAVVGYSVLVEYTAAVVAENNSVLAVQTAAVAAENNSVLAEYTAAVAVENNPVLVDTVLTPYLPAYFQQDNRILGIRWHCLKPPSRI